MGKRISARVAKVPCLDIGKFGAHSHNPDSARAFPHDRHASERPLRNIQLVADTTEELDYVPASFVIREYVRPKYACASCQQGVVQAALPARTIEKGRPGPGLWAHVVGSKYADHLPLYRLKQIFERHGVAVTRRTLSEWNGAVADLLEPIVRAMHREQLCQSPWIQ